MRLIGASTASSTNRAARRVAQGKRILAFLFFTSGLWFVWKQWNSPDQLRNPIKPACSEVVFEGDHFTVCRFDPVQHQLELALSAKDGATLRGFSALAADRGKEANKIIFAMNAGMYDFASQPVGLYVEDGKEIRPINLNDGPGNFHMKPNGIFWLDAAGAHVAESSAYAALGPTPKFASQSGPMLVIDSKLHPQFTQDGQSRHIRNGVGPTSDGGAVFVISNNEVSFGKFARLFRDKLSCRNALYFDGLVSSLWDAGTGRIDQRFPLGPMLVVSER